MVEATEGREVPVRWRTFSLAIKNEDAEVPEPYRSLGLVALGALRVVEAVWAQNGDEAVGPLYTEIGRRFHLEGDRSRAAVTRALEACGLDPGLAGAADDETFDEEIRASMADAMAMVGTEVGVPILAFHEVVDGHEASYAISGPVMSPAATGEDALDLWDHVVGVARHRNVFEMKRARTAGPQFGRDTK